MKSLTPTLLLLIASALVLHAEDAPKIGAAQFVDAATGKQYQVLSVEADGSFSAVSAEATFKSTPLVWFASDGTMLSVCNRDEQGRILERLILGDPADPQTTVTIAFTYNAEDQLVSFTKHQGETLTERVEVSGITEEGIYQGSRYDENDSVLGDYSGNPFKD